ncbi:MAG: hypothetical protein V1869_06795 [Candidatus Omnitrophota bacterium]
MEGKIEALIKLVYGRRKKRLRPKGAHLDEQDLACFLEGKLGDKEMESARDHLVNCRVCAESLALSLNAGSAGQKEVPGSLIDRVRRIFNLKRDFPVLEVVLRLKENMLEIINSTGDILIGQELVAAPLARSRNIKDFEDEVTILKDFKDIGLELKVENKKEGCFNAWVRLWRKQGLGALKGLRVVLSRDGLELESYLSESGLVTFERVLPGKYTLEATSQEGRLALVFLEIMA